MAVVLGIILKQAPTKHAETIGLLERSHASIKQTLKVEIGERRSLWQINVSSAVLNFKTFLHTSSDCEPSRASHGRIHYNILDLKLGIRPQQQPIPMSQIAEDILDQTEMIHQGVGKNSMQTYYKYKANFGKKANASNLKKADCVYVLQPRRIIKEVNFDLPNFGGLALTALKNCTQKHLSGTQNWHQQDASTSYYENASAHTPSTSKRYTNHATSMET